MIITQYRCDLCKKECHHPCGGVKVSFSGCGGICFYNLDDEKVKDETILCNHCLKGLKNKILKHSCENDCQKCIDAKY